MDMSYFCCTFAYQISLIFIILLNENRRGIHFFTLTHIKNMAITVVNAPDTAYSGSPSPNAAFISGNDSFTIKSWSGSIQPGTPGNTSYVQLYIRQWNLVDGVWHGNTIWSSGWDGANLIEFNGGIGRMQPGLASPTWPAGSTFQVSPTQQWSILAQTGSVGGATDTSTNMIPTFDPSTNQLTFSGVSGPSGTGNIVVVIQADEPDM
jgi:hypothetical protein